MVVFQLIHFKMSFILKLYIYIVCDIKNIALGSIER